MKGRIGWLCAFLQFGGGGGGGRSILPTRTAVTYPRKENKHGTKLYYILSSIHQVVSAMRERLDVRASGGGWTLEREVRGGITQLLLHHIHYYDLDSLPMDRRMEYIFTIRLSVVEPR